MHHVLTRTATHGPAPTEGVAAPLGATPVEGGVNFAVFSAHAEALELVLFAPDARTITASVFLPGRTGEVWHGFVPGLRAGQIYGYRAHGPWAPSQGHRFNPTKLLLDPYAKALAGDFVWGPEHYSTAANGRRDARDNAATAWKARVVDPAALSPMPMGPRVPWERTLICETHVRGFTIAHPALSEAERGKFAGLATPVALDHLKALGVTAIELLPTHAFLNDHRLHDQGLANFWGYNTLAYFAPHPAYGGADVNAEMRRFVQAAHDRGMEVLLDVVYNHTCEGDHRGPTISFKGLDNASYYRLRPDDKAHYADITGCGATLDASRPVVRQLVRDSLAHFAQAYGVDGFRFDLATQLGVGPDGVFRPDAPLLTEINADPRLRDLKLIAEPWDAAGGFQVGGFPAPWAEWNAHARDSIRRFWRGDAHETAAFATRLAGSADIYASKGRAMASGVTMVTCHDGFTTMDVVSWSRKRNHANLENNRDGGDHDFSANHGVEGPTDDPAILALRERQWRNLMATTLLSFGTPMILAGDEFGRTQGGNNNAYNQDNETSWLDWSLANGPKGRERIAFVRRVAALRGRIHGPLGGGFPAHPGGPTISWWSVWGAPMTHADWSHDRALALWIETGGWLLVMNADHRAHRFTLPGAGAGVRWSGVLDTGDPSRPEGATLVAGGQIIDVPDRTLRVYAARTAQAKGVAGRGY
jgi:glycogen operon protein